MSTLTVTSGAVLLGIGAIQPSDTFQNGVLTSATGGLNRAVPAGGDEYSNGLLRTDAGQIRYFDATAGLPAGTQWANGLPFSTAGALCISTNAASTYSNGIPFAANGAVAAGII
jgi:hypothetical protein